MKKLFCMILALAILAGLHASAESVPEDGLYTVGVSSSSRMFKVMDCLLYVEDRRMTATLTLSGKGYGFLYQGTAAEADAAPEERLAPFAPDWEGKYRYSVEIPGLDQDVAVAGYSTRYEKWYDRTLQFFSSTLSPHDEIAPDGVYTGILRSNVLPEGAQCLLAVEDGQMQISADAEAAAALGLAYDAGEVKSFPIRSLDTRVPMAECLDGADVDGWLKLETASLREYAVTVADGVYLAQVETDSGLLRFSDCMITVRDGKMTALLTAANNNFDYLYLGLSKDAPKDEAAWIPALPDANGANTYIINLTSLDNEFQIATYSAKKKMWYDRTAVIDADSLTSVS